MSSEDLPDELDKLKIATVLPQVKLLDSNLPLTLNPFYDEDIKDEGAKSSLHQLGGNPQQEQITPHRNVRRQFCRRLRRRSDSVLDDYKVVTPLSTDGSNDSGKRASGINKQPLKKSSPSSINRKIIIREPVLRALQTCLCLRPQSNARRKLLNANEEIDVSCGVGAGVSAPINNVSSNVDGVLGFRDLINECQVLLEQDVEFSGRINQLNLSHHSSKSFTTMQTVNTKHRTRNNSYSSSGGGKNDSRNYTTRTTSCSQQAGNSVTTGACDDVTIDELASYFDTLVHIPKKMSSMAEMMYI